MKNINLIPKIPLVQRVFLPVILITIGVAVLSAVSLYFYGTQLKGDIQHNDAEMNQLRASIQVLAQQKTLDQQTKDYQQLSAEIDKLKSDRRSWMPVMDLVTSQLPQIARITTMGVVPETNEAKTNNPAAQPPQANFAQKPGKHLAINAEFGELNDIAEYVIRLQQSALLEGVAIKSIIRVDGEVQPVTVAPFPMQPVPASKPVMSTQEYISNIEKSIPSAETESDALLNQLRWTVNQRMVGQQFGIELPDKSFTPPKNGTSSGSSASEDIVNGSAITQKEIIDAKKQLEQFKSQNKSSSLAVPDRLPAVPAAPAPIKYTKYQVSLELALTPLSKEK